MNLYFQFSVGLVRSNKPFRFSRLYPFGCGECSFSTSEVVGVITAVLFRAWAISGSFVVRSIYLASCFPLPKTLSLLRCNVSRL